MANRLSRTLGSLAIVVWLLSGCGGGDPYRQLTPYERHIYLEPTPLATTLVFDRVAQGYDASCMLASNGEAWCWGGNEHGQLGAGTAQACSGGNIPCTWQPLRVAAPMQFAVLSPGQIHSCGLDAAAQAWCWGFGLGGQLGDGRSVDSATPVAVAGGHRFVQIDAGRTSLLSCALDAVGTAWCWGPSGGGALGNGTVDMASSPVQVLATQPFTSVGAGSDHACGLDASGQAWCWGHNAYGKLGLGAPGAALLPTAVVGGQRFASIAVGGEFNCGLTAAGAAWCWGFGPSLGDGVGLHRDAPTAVSGAHLFVSLSAGYQHACGLKSDGSAWCWGMAALVGGGTEQTSLAPVAVSGGHRFRTLQAGGVATCAITVAGTPMCWGINTVGSVGQSNIDP
ncbi:RCC1 domain-containing protein [Piscinibacter sp.]|uniref:RCC1 domain-containing protein n=1 Tax=Piscinibacter sp. TaxID=1903157 RepID=UPI00355A6F74